jgi:hypothetical protein
MVGSQAEPRCPRRQRGSDPRCAQFGFLTSNIKRLSSSSWPAGPDASKLTVVTTGMGPKTAREFAGGMVYIVSGLKTFLETGAPIAIAAG